MSVISVVQNKGGDGKSTTAISLAIYFAHMRKKRTLLFDFDPQCNSSSRFLKMEYDEAASATKDSTWRPPLHPDFDETDPENEGWDGRSSSADLFLGNDGIEPYPCSQFPNLKIAPGWSSRLDTVERVLSEDVGSMVIRKTQALMDVIEKDDLFDIVIFDTPPLLRPLTLAALGSATDVIIPMQLSQPSLNGLFAILNQIENQKAIRVKPINVAGIVPNRVKGNTVRTKKVLKQLQDHPIAKKLLLKTSIPEREGIAMLCEWGDHNKSDELRTFDSPFSNVASNKEIRNLMIQFCEEVEGRLKSND